MPFLPQEIPLDLKGEVNGRECPSHGLEVLYPPHIFFSYRLKWLFCAYGGIFSFFRLPFITVQDTNFSFHVILQLCLTLSLMILKLVRAFKEQFYSNIPSIC